MGRLNERVAAVTGAGSGIGRATALLLAEEGARIAVVSRSPAELETLVHEVADRGSEAAAFPCDVQDAAGMEEVYRDVDRRFGRCDIVFANAGINGVWAP